MRRPRPLATIACTVVAVLATGSAATAAAGLGGGGGGGACPGFVRGGALSMLDSCFAGTAHLLDAGARSVDVSNDGELPHTLTAVDGSFDLRLEPGARGSVVVPDRPFVLVYCTLHGTPEGAGMAGVLVTEPVDQAEGAAAGVAVQGAAAGAVQDDDGAPLAPLVGIVVALLGVVVAAVMRLSRRPSPAQDT